MTSKFFDLLNSIIPLSKDASEELIKIISISKLPKGTLLLAEGQVSDKLFFLCEGIARAFYYENGDEITSWIVSKNDFIYSTTSFIQQRMSFETIHLLEDSVVISINHRDLEDIYKKHPETIYIALKITEKYLLLYDERVRSLRLPAEEKYHRFQAQFPHISANVKIKYLASYLGISRSCLQSLRSKK
ncbi:MAG: Crp/Fnr family transcriptional regulator [Flavobacterium sp.]